MKQIFIIALVALLCFSHFLDLATQGSSEEVEAREVPVFAASGFSSDSEQEKNNTLNDIAKLLGVEFSKVSQQQQQEAVEVEPAQQVADVIIRVVSIYTVGDKASVRVKATRGEQTVDADLSIGSKLHQLEVLEITPKQIVFTDNKKQYAIDIYRPQKVKS